MTALATMGLLVCLCVPGYRRFALLGGYAASLTVAPAVLAMGVDRYAMMAEPALYVLIVVLASLTLLRGLRPVARLHDGDAAS